MRYFILVTCLLTTILSPRAAHAADASEPIAEIDGQAVTWAELETFAADPLREIDKKRHQILEASLGGLIEQRLLEREAARRQVTVPELLAAEIEAKTEPVTGAEVDAWYEENRARVRQPKDAVAAQIRAFLEQQRADPLRRELVAGLRRQYGVKVHFEPLRLDVGAAEGPARGPADAAVTVVEFSDFECPACKRIEPDLKRLKEAYPDRVRFAFRQFPLTSIHPRAFKAAEAALCAEDQGRFWDMHDDLFEHQRQLGVEQIKERARELGLDGAAFDSCLDGGVQSEAVQADLNAGRHAGITGTPSIFVNGRPVTLLRGVSPFDTISALIEDELGRAGDS